MTHAKRLWFIWQALLSAFAWAFTGPSFRRFAEWVTAMATTARSTPSPSWSWPWSCRPTGRRRESFAEDGAWHPDYVPASLTRLVETAPGRLGTVIISRPSMTPRSIAIARQLPGTCTFHSIYRPLSQSSSPDRAGPQLGGARGPARQPRYLSRCLPLSGRLYFRKSQLPLQSQDSDHTVVFRTKCELVVELIPGAAGWITGGRHLGIFDGAYALPSVVRPLVQPEPGAPPHRFGTRSRPDARDASPPAATRVSGLNQKWGRRLPPPCQGGRWSGPWQEGEGFIYGRQRHVRWKEQVCLWWVAGAEVPVKVVVAEVEGYRQRFHLVSSATELTGVEMVEGFAGRFRQEDVFRDLKNWTLRIKDDFMSKPVLLYEQFWLDKRYLKMLTCRGECDLSKPERKVLSFLVFKARDKAAVGTRVISRASGLDRRTVWAATKRLMDLGLAASSKQAYLALVSSSITPSGLLVACFVLTDPATSKARSSASRSVVQFLFFGEPSLFRRRRPALCLLEEMESPESRG